MSDMRVTLQAMKLALGALHEPPAYWLNVSQKLADIAIRAIEQRNAICGDIATHGDEMDAELEKILERKP